MDWYPWGNEALERAEKEERPIFLSIGYSACHWCHVMERESFEDEEIAAFLNKNFISIKVDREERPDLDDLYMAAVQRMTGSGGWPMTVFLTPDLKPFYGGTYFPPRAQGGRPGFLELLQGVAEAWGTRRQEVEENANRIAGMLEVQFPPLPETGLPDMADLQAREVLWTAAFSQVFDPRWGGFGQAPKFPRAEDIRWLLARGGKAGKDMALTTLRRMAEGGIYDQLGGGFARYSTDEKWLIPHFEKMLYDQGTLVPAYLEAWQATGDAFFSDIAEETCSYLLRERRDPAGGFWSATDADSEGEEGKFFVWTPDQLEETLGKEDADFAAGLLGITPSGNFEHGTSAATRAGDFSDPRASSVRKRLYEARLKRIPPGNDDKILVAWNGLAIDALARAGRILGEEQFTAAAAEAATFLLEELREDGVWRRSWRGGQARNAAVLEDLAYLMGGFLSLFQATGHEPWLKEAGALGDKILETYGDRETGILWENDGFDATVLHRMKSPWDGATPSPNSVALNGFARLHAFTQEPRWREALEEGCRALLPLADPNPRGYPSALRVFPLAVEEPSVAVVVGGKDGESFEIWRTTLHSPSARPALVVMAPKGNPDSKLGIFKGRAPLDGKATLYFCRGSTCEAPATTPPDTEE